MNIGVKSSGSEVLILEGSVSGYVTLGKLF